VLDSNEDKGAYDTGVAGVMQGATAGKPGFSISFAGQKQVERQPRREK
jgi:hypothetical protein